MPPRKQSIGLDNPVFSGRLRAPQRQAGRVAPLQPRVHPGQPAPLSQQAMPPRPAPPPLVPQQAQQTLAPQVPLQVSVQPQAQIPRPQPAQVAPPQQTNPVPQTQLAQAPQVPLQAPQAPVQQAPQPAPVESQPAQAAQPQPDQPVYEGTKLSIKIPKPKAVSLKSLKQEITLPLAAAILLLIGLPAGIGIVHKNKNQLGSNNTPSLASVAALNASAQAFNNYHVAPYAPRYIKIPTLDIYSEVQSTTLDGNGIPSLPPNPSNAGWVTSSPELSLPGASLIVGSGSNTANAIFSDLSMLTQGDTVQVARGDGTVFNYQVITSQIFSSPKLAMASASHPINGTKVGLNLMAYQDTTSSAVLNQTIVVYAQEIPNN